MRVATVGVQMGIRGIGVIMLVLGLLFWTGNALQLVLVHILLGLALVAALWTMAFLGWRAGAPRPLITLVVAAGLLLPILGLNQDRLMVMFGGIGWPVQVVHLLVGLAAIGMAEALGARTKLRWNGKRFPDSKSRQITSPH